MRPTRLLLFIVLTSSTLCAIPRECARKIKKTCRGELNKMSLVSFRLSLSPFPPLSNPLSEYNILLQSALACASAVKCAKGHELKEVFDSIHDRKVAEQKYIFDSVCIEKVLLEAYNRNYPCSREYDFMTRDPSKKHEVFTSGKWCILEIANATCSSQFNSFLNTNYDDIMGMYTVQPDQDLCNSAFDKFHDDQCFPFGESLIPLMSGLLVNVTESEMNRTMMACRQYQHCLEESCLYAEERREKGQFFVDTKVICDGLESFSKVWKNNFLDRSVIRGLKCVQDWTFSTTVRAYISCKMRKLEENCWAKTIEHSEACKQEIVEMMVEKQLISPDECGNDKDETK